MGISVWKYPLKFVTEQTVDVELGAEILHVGAIEKLSVSTFAGSLDGNIRYGEPSFFLWARVHGAERNAPQERIRISMVPAGLEAPPDPYIGTTIVCGGRWIWHWFMQRDWKKI